MNGEVASRLGLGASVLVTGSGSVSGTTSVTGGTINGSGLTLTGLATFNSTGNTLLSVIANIIYNNIRITDMVCRVGGDEFVVLFTETDAEQTKAVLNKIQKVLFESMQKNGWPVTFSIGAVTYIHAPNDVETILKASDELMYYAKRSGKNQIKFETYSQK